MSTAPRPASNRTSPRSAAPVALVALVLGVACLQGARAPNVAPRGTLAPGGEEAAAAGLSKPVSVVFAAPKGDVVDPAEISVVFDRPMRALDLAGEEAPTPIAMRPAVEGRWGWVGTTALQFVPKDHLPRASTLTVEVPAGTRALDGTALAEPYAFAFTTARPAVAGVVPSEQDGLLPATKFELRFNQPVRKEDAETALRLEVGDAPKPAPFTLERPDPKNEQLLVLAPRAPLPVDSAVAIHVAPTLRGTEGPLTATKAQSFRFRTYGPLGVVKVGCDEDTPHGRCASGGGFSIELTNRVKVADLKKALKVDPPVKLAWPEWLGDSEPMKSVSLGGRFLPGRSYRVTVAGALKDEHGQPLGKDFRREVAFDDLWPVAQIGVSGSVLEPTARREIPVAAVNVKELEVATAPLDDAGVLELAGAEESQSRALTVSAIAKRPGAKVVKRHGSASGNKPARSGVRPEDVLGGKDKRGTIAIGVAYDDRPGTRQEKRVGRTAIVQVTDLAVSAKVSPHGSIVWVTRLSTGAPVEGATVSIRRLGDASPVAVRTDAAGFATVPEAAFRPATSGPESGVIFARTADDVAWRRVADALSGSRFDVPVRFSEDRPFGMMFTDRGVYRPGDTVHVKGIVRKESHPGTVTPSGLAVKLKVEGPNGDDVVTLAPTLGAFGTFTADVVVPDTGKLGTYQLAATVDGGAPREWGADLTGDFDVAEYRPAEFKVAVESDRPAYVRGDKAKWSTHGELLFGAAMAGADVRWSVRRSRAWFTPPGLEGFVTDEGAFTASLADATEREGELVASRAKLDAKGNGAIDAALALPGQRGAEEVTAEAEVTDLSRQSQSGSTTALVHPAAFYLALKPAGDVFVKAGEAQKVELLAADPAGAKVAGVAARVELVSRTWTVARQETGGGSYHSVSTPVDKVVASCDVKTAQAPVGCALTAPTAGYYLVHATAADRRGNPIGAAYGFYALGEGEVGWGDSDKLAVELVADRKSYEVGQTARVLVKSPWKSAEAWVTVERAGVYSSKRVTLAGATPTIEVPITDELRPNAFVSVLLVRGRGKAPPAKPEAADVGAPAFRMGYAALHVNPEARRFKVAVKPSKTDVAPGDPVDVDVEVRDKDGKPARAEVALYAVDEGVLALTAYKTPDPIPVFGAPRALRVATIEARAALARVRNPFGELGLDKGLDGGDGGGMTPRRDFRAAALWAPSIVTDAAGHAHASFKVPDSLTTYRVMAVAVGETDRFGYADARVVASKKLMARPTFPRFLRAGDAAEAGIIVTSKGLASAKIEIEASFEGLALEGDAKRTVELAAGESTEVRFALKAPRVGKAKARFRVRGGGAEDAVEITRDVAPPLAPEAVALSGETAQASAEKLGDLGSLRDDVGGLEVSLASTALVGLEAGLGQLVEYPYGCTEQLTSRLVPLVGARDLAKDFHLALPGDADKMAAVTVAKILTHQRGDGGFGLWEDSTASLPFVSAYALFGLGEAKRRGVAVPAAALENATRYVRKALEKKAPGEADLAAQAFVVDVLALEGAPDPGRMTKLFEAREKLPLFAKAFLAHALAIGKGDREAVEAIATELEQGLRLDGPAAHAVANESDAYAPLMDSNTRTTAVVLRALLAAKPGHPLAAKLAMGLLADRRGGTWRTTQEAAWALLALDDYRKVAEKPEPDFDARVFLGQAEVFEHAFRGRDVSQAAMTVPADRLVAADGAPLAFSVDGKGELFYQARLRYAKKELPAKPIERGFFVKKTLRPVTAEGLAKALAIVPDASATGFHGGDLVLADVVVVAPSPRRFVVIDDPLPAGFEAVDARLAATSHGLDVDATPDEEPTDDDRARGGAFSASQFLRELRDDRVLFFVDHLPAGMYRYRYLARATSIGSYVAPPTRVEEMYTPEVFGRTAAARVTVAP
jgi:hypothetical protein